MSTIAEERAQPAGTDGRGVLLERLVAWRPVITVEVMAYAAVLLVAFALRFWDLGARAMHHDESLHATYSWYLYKGRGYEHHPLMHGPLLFHAMAAVYLLFGVSEATSRFVPAAFGTAMVLLPLLLRPWLGRAGAFAAAALIALSPTILYFSRFVGAGAQDIVVAVAMLLMVAGIWHYLRSGLPRWLYVIAAGLAVGFTTKEVTYMLAAILCLYLNGAAAADFAAQWSAPWRRDASEDRPDDGAIEDSPLPEAASQADPTRRRVTTLAFLPVAWALVLFWPFLGGLRERLRLRTLPRAGEALIVLGTLAAPMFSAGVQVLLEKAGVQMEAQAPFGDWTNEKLWGALTIGGLIALGAYFGTAWRAREWLIAAAIFWGISVPLFTTFFTNPDGIATGIWGSLDYWLQQQDVRRGNQPVFYYLMLTPVYEYVTLALATAGIVCAAVKSGWDTVLAATVAALACLGAVLIGDGAHGSLPFAAVALLAATYAMRGYPFRQFVVFWAGALLLGLSAAGEKMPWLEVHLALPLALLAALALNEAYAAATRAVRAAGATAAVSDGADAEPAPAVPVHGLPAWAGWVAALAAVGLLAAVLALASDTYDWANRMLVIVLALGVLGAVALAVRRVPAAGLAAAALALGFFGPLSVRAAAVAAYEHGDVPVEMLVYTQTTPELARVRDEVDRYARESGLGYDLPIVVDATEAFTWPWAWYLRDYKRVSYPDLTAYQNNPALIATLPRDGVVLAQLANSGVGAAAGEAYGPGQRFQHRAWFPEDQYRGTTGRSFFEWLTDPGHWKLWGMYFLHRVPPAPLGSIDAVAYFPAGWQPGQAIQGQIQAAPEPVLEDDGRLVVGAPGGGRGQLQRPAGLAIDLDGSIYVADSLNNRVQKYGPDGRFQAVIGAPGQMKEPWGVAVDQAGTVYVADTWNHRILKFDGDGRLLQTWGRPPTQAGAPNPDPLELYGPRAIAIDRAGNLWVTDTGNSRLVKYSPDGRPLGTFGSPGAGPGQFQEPVAVAIAPDGDLLITDTWNGRVQRFDASFGYKGEFKITGWASKGIENKPYVAASGDGSVYVTEPDTGRVLHYGSDGKFLGLIEPVGDNSGPQPRPLGVAVDPEGKVWVSDGVHYRIVRLAGCSAEHGTVHHC